MEKIRDDIGIASVDFNKKIKNLDKSIKSDYKNNKKDHERFDNELTRLSELTDDLSLTYTKDSMDLNIFKDDIKNSIRGTKMKFIVCYVLISINTLIAIVSLITSILR